MRRVALRYDASGYRDALRDLDLLHRLLCFSPHAYTQQWREWGLYIMVVRFVQVFINARSHPPVLCMNDADHHTFVDIYTFFQKIETPASISGQIITWEAKNLKCENINKWGPKRC